MPYDVNMRGKIGCESDRRQGSVYYGGHFLIGETNSIAVVLPSVVDILELGMLIHMLKGIGHDRNRTRIKQVAQHAHTGHKSQGIGQDPPTNERAAGVTHR